MRWFWFDRYTEFVAGTRAIAVKSVTLSEDYLHDHWESYPLMPNTLIAEGMAQASGLLVSEVYRFSELVVLAKFSKCAFDGEVRPGDTLTYQANIVQAKEMGASVMVTAHVGDHRQAEAEIFFARLSTNGSERPAEMKLFDPVDLLHWLRIVGVFKVGIRPDGTRLRAEEYGFDAQAP
ncbi:MAG TPA: 3-hydroxyacyl-ACP dehydratase FabZ family protein [Lacipirellulaceae bacterium]|jgi:3-hydroxyacyl-[acyl-carrier-protein] dehydratase